MTRAALIDALTGGLEVNVSSLARDIGVHRSSLTRSIRSLERRGAVHAVGARRWKRGAVAGVVVPPTRCACCGSVAFGVVVCPMCRAEVAA